MPVTARLSGRFYEKFGDDIANELVGWFNMVDSTYRSELRELNELNFGRFDAKLEQRVAQLDAKLEERVARLDAKLEQRVAQLDAKLEQRTAQLDATIERRIAEIKAEMRVLESRVEARIAASEVRIIKWMFLFWVGQAATTVALVFGVVRLTGR